MMDGVGWTYLAYLLRLWPAGRAQTAWRASLENARSGEQRSFRDLDSLLAFLRAQMVEARNQADVDSPEQAKER